MLEWFEDIYILERIKSVRVTELQFEPHNDLHHFYGLYMIYMILRKCKFLGHEILWKYDTEEEIVVCIILLNQ